MLNFYLKPTTVNETYFITKIQSSFLFDFMWNADFFRGELFFDKRMLLLTIDLEKCLIEGRPLIGCLIIPNGFVSEKGKDSKAASTGNGKQREVSKLVTVTMVLLIAMLLFLADAAQVNSMT